MNLKLFRPFTKVYILPTLTLIYKKREVKYPKPNKYLKEVRLIIKYYKMSIKILLGKKIKNLRLKNGLTQEELAKMIGISQRSLSGIEIGKNFLTAETLDKILSCLKINTDELFALEHLKPGEDLKTELIEKISSLNDDKKIKTVYNVVNAILKD